MSDQENQKVTQLDDETLQEVTGGASRLSGVTVSRDNLCLANNPSASEAKSGRLMILITDGKPS